ncbi:MAG: hypothetical protein A3A27_01760 [Candidatus Wildermuthbacteria bacterium RIFCSPLOWO2_01_FULL_47_18]|uniref:DegT/DnrJ/EryC1/StrS aminotransferase n=2 Tax=Candidatus Wildermuthiibacteriota TaxID=1817923 RepID=A0A1G2RHU4_9BACT|nr:MAG: hypothetical protein A3J68_00455 [Candidatus Wildermuthbacteria bacterium RIFCSPHIGHO2_02_FULL_48_16]OHA72406.1 MAG: hypothetical protein A3A27_01760 [Candidatus Wildermuthbacteria bacterium RIFCSPLOWO2_01_FULL_47_18]
MKYIQEVEAPGLRDLFGWAKNSEAQKALGKDVLDKIQFVGSGKGAISLVLRYLFEKKVLLNRLDEIMVADWMGYGVYNQMQPHAFLAKRASERTKAIFVYHQYGFPQNMEAIMKFAKAKKLVVIEDCAHALFSSYKGKRLGTFGDFAIYSFSKWVFCFALGGMTSRFKDFHAFAQKAISSTPLGATFLKDATKFLYERSRFSGSRRFYMYANLLSDASYAFYKEALLPSTRAVRLLESKIGNEINVRAKRYQYFLEKTNGLALSHSFEREGIVPYMIPVHCPEKKNNEIVDALKKIGIMTGVYNFDMNRNMLSPKFVPCVLLPCHGGISEELFSHALSLILKKL